LEPDIQKEFLQYLVPCEQLFNASDPEVFDVFRRLNTYNYVLSPQELRHGKYHGTFRNAVINTSRKWSVLWDKYEAGTKRSRVRMADDEFIAQLYGVVLEGVCDGGQPAIEKLYKAYDNDLPSYSSKRVDSTLGFITDELAPVMDTRLAAAPQLLMVFGAVAHARIGIPPGDLEDDLPPRTDDVLKDVPASITNLCTLAGMLELGPEEVPSRFVEFVTASSKTTQRIRSRRVRFRMIYAALLPEPI
jgi:hypothetical protein